MQTLATLHGATCQIPFVHYGQSGRVTITYSIDEDPAKAGFDILPGRTFDIGLCRGYPTVHAVIDRYEGHGIRTLFGWIQVVTNKGARLHPGGELTKTENISDDIIPSMQDCGMPFYNFGNLPQFFDSPCLNLGENTEVKWSADTFLTTVPIRSKVEEISWLLGFRWGYVEDDKGGKQPVSILPLEPTDGGAWNMHLPFLRNTYTDWNFKET